MFLGLYKLAFVIFVYTKAVKCRNFKIIGGEVGKIENFPFQVIYYSNRKFVCSGILISRNFVLTAAHCTLKHSSNILIRLGSSFRRKNGVIVGVKKFYFHPNYNPRTKDFDFSLLELAVPVRFTNSIQPASLARANSFLPVGTQCTASGWGLQDFKDSKSLSEQLMSVTIRIIDFQACRNSYKWRNFFLTNRMICAGVPDGSKDSCNGDSGGPLVCNGTVWGIVSFGFECGRKDFPGVYARVSAVIPWIKEVTKLPLS